MQHDFKNLRIIQLEAENIKRLRAVSIRPVGSVVEITGENEQGKTSVLDAIWWLFSGERGIQVEPIALGKERAIIRGVLSDGTEPQLIVIRTFDEKKDGKPTTSVRVQSPDGAVYPKTQEMLTGLIGNMSFDPLSFMRLKPKEQFDALKGMVPGFDFEEHDALRKGLFQDRTDVNRRAREAAAAAANIRVPTDAPARVDETALVAELERAGQVNADIEVRKGRRQAAEDRREAAIKVSLALTEEIRRLEARLSAAKSERDAADRESEDIQARLDAAGPLPDPVDTGAVREQIAAARRTNAAAEAVERAIADKQRLEREASEYADAAAELTAQLDAMDEAKAAAIAAAKLPVEGLTFGDGEILLNGVPFDQSSMSQKIRTGVAIAMAGNPALRVCRILDASLLGKAAWDDLVNMADEHGFQVWVETVNSTRPTAIVIEDGAVAGEPVPDVLEASRPKPARKSRAVPAESAAVPAEAPPLPEEGLPWDAQANEPTPAAPAPAPARRTLFGED